MKAKIFAAIALISAVGCKPNSPPPPAIPEPFTSGEQLVESMRNRYVDRWYRTETHVQTIVDLRKSPADTSVWYFAFSQPSVLRIDFDPLTAGNGFLVRGDSLYAMQRGNLVEVNYRPDPLLVLSFSVYHDAASTSINRLRGAGFDLSKIRLDNWEGRQAYVVGSSDAQFWVEREHLLVVRIISGKNDTRLGNYKQIGRAWVASSLEVYSGGSLELKEERQHIRIDAPVDLQMFAPATWSTARHWYNQR